MKRDYKKVICIDNDRGYGYHSDIKIGNIYYSEYNHHLHQIYMIYNYNYDFVTAFNTDDFERLFKSIEKIREERINELL